VAGEHPVDEIEALPDLGEMHAEVGQHVEVLASLPREQEGHPPAGLQRLLEEVDPVDFLDLLAARVREPLGRPLQLLAQLGHGRRDHGEPAGAVAERHVQRVGEVLRSTPRRRGRRRLARL
jgi:hypothetical protein